MSQVSVKTVSNTGEALSHLARLMRDVNDEIRERAYRLFLERAGEDGRDLDDWIAAERELLCSPPCEVTENETEVRIKAQVQGFDAKAIQVDVLPESITIESCAGGNVQGKGKKQANQKRLLRQFELPARIHPERVKATLEKGVLEVIAKKEVSTVTPIVKEVKLGRSAAA